MHLKPVRPPVVIAPQCLKPSILFRHPGYNQAENVLFALPPLDTAADDDEHDAIGSGLHGVHHGTALVAGQIIVGNVDAAFLTYDRNGEQPVQIAREGVLTRGDYFLQVPPQSSTPYAITPNFEEWRFPHGRLPGPWASLEGAYQGVTRTEFSSKSRCIISAAGPSTVDTAHVVPQSATSASWFDRNGMRAYSGSNVAVTAADSPNNVIRIRSDLHRDFDSRAFVFVPKPVTSPERCHLLAVHFLAISGDLADSATQYHNQLVHYSAVPAEYLFARFAYAVFGLVKTFVLQGAHRRLALVEYGQVDWTTTVSDMDYIQRDNLYGGGGSRRSSPRKRARGQQAVDEDALDGSFGYQSASDDDEPRGRRRRLGRWVSSDDDSDVDDVDEPRAPLRCGEPVICH